MVSLAECELWSDIQNMKTVAAAVAASNAIGNTRRVSTHPVCPGVRDLAHAAVAFAARWRRRRSKPTKARLTTAAIVSTSL